MNTLLKCLLWMVVVDAAILNGLLITCFIVSIKDKISDARLEKKLEEEE